MTAQPTTALVGLRDRIKTKYFHFEKIWEIYFIFKFVYEYESLCVHMSILAQRNQKRNLDPLQLEF